MHSDPDALLFDGAFFQSVLIHVNAQTVAAERSGGAVEAESEAGCCNVGLKQVTVVRTFEVDEVGNRKGKRPAGRGKDRCLTNQAAKLEFDIILTRDVNDSYAAGDAAAFGEPDVEDIARFHLR
jgi:hypothetical protein